MLPSKVCWPAQSSNLSRIRIRMYDVSSNLLRVIVLLLLEGDHETRSKLKVFPGVLRLIEGAGLRDFLTADSHAHLLEVILHLVGFGRRKW